MLLDSIQTKSKPKQIPTPVNRNKVVIPVIIIVVALVIVWLIVLRYNFSRINQKNQSEDPAAQEVNQAFQNLIQKLDNLKEQKIFRQATSTQDNSFTPEQESQTSTKGYPYPSEDIPEGMPSQQY